jgi:uncharacterized OsmC-like protein
MKAQELRNLQEPLKSSYREDPTRALVTLKAQSTIGEGISCKVETGKAMMVAGLHPATGGDGTLVCTGDMLLEALSACAGVTLKAVATAIEFDLKNATIYAEGDLDFRGTLSVDRNAPVGFVDIRLRFDLETSEEASRIDKLIQLTERYCVIYQTLVHTNTITVSYD